ncbi:MAG: hypothetical protein IH955_01125 [Chloroflexi bacterium]|nr:hypothetical protein [Chloroflexota bacterium]
MPLPHPLNPRRRTWPSRTIWLWLPLLLAIAVLALVACNGDDAPIPTPLPSPTPTPFLSPTPDPKVIPSEILGETRVFEGVTLERPLRILYSDVTFQGLSYDTSVTGNLLHVTGSTIRFVPPYPDLSPSLWGSDLVVIEDSTIVFEDIQTDDDIIGYPWPFTLVRGSTLVYQNIHLTGDRARAFEAVMPPPEIFQGRNTLTFRDTSLPGSLSGAGTDYVLENWTGNDLSIVNDNSLRLTRSQVGELRALDDARLTLEDVTALEAIYLREGATATILNSRLLNELRVSGRASLAMRRSSFSRAVFLGRSQARIEDLQPAQNGSSSVLITVGGDSRLEIIDTSLLPAPDDEALVVGDRARVLLERVRGLSGRHRFYGDAEVTLVESSASSSQPYEIFLTGRARLRVKDSTLDAVYLQDEAVLELENSTIGRVYYQVVVQGQATLTQLGFTGQVSINTPTLDSTSTVEEMQPLVFVPKGASLAASDAEIKRLTVEGEASLESTAVGELWVTGANALVNVSGGSIQTHYFSLHSDGPRGLVRDGAGLTDIRLVEANIGSNTIVGERKLGLISATGDHLIEIQGTEVQRLRAGGDARAILVNVDFQHLETTDSAVVTILGSGNKARNNINRGHVLSPDFPGQVEAYGDSIVSIESSDLMFNAVVYDQALLTLNRSRIGSLMARDQASATLQNSEVANLVAQDQARITAFGSTIAQDSYVLDRTEVSFVCSRSRDLFIGARNDSLANGILWIVDSPEIVSGGCQPEQTRYPLSGLVPLAAFPQVDNPSLEDAGLSAFGVVGFRILVDGQPSDSMRLLDDRFDWTYSSGQEPLIGYGWDTTLVGNGRHSITLVARGLDGVERRWTTFLAVEN